LMTTRSEQQPSKTAVLKKLFRIDERESRRQLRTLAHISKRDLLRTPKLKQRSSSKQTLVRLLRTLR